MLDLVAIDPGIRAMGWAAFEKGTLIDAGASICPKGCGSLLEAFMYHVYEIPSAKDIVVEYMEHHTNRAGSQANDLLGVQWMGATVSGRLAKTNVYPLRPSQWKGNLPKTVHHKRIANALKAKEVIPLNTALSQTRNSNHKEIFDAVGIGMYHINRIDRAGRPL